MPDNKNRGGFMPPIDYFAFGPPIQPGPMSYSEREELNLLRRAAKEQDEVLQQIQQRPLQYATVLRLYETGEKKWATVAFSGAIADVQIGPPLLGKLKVGGRVRIVPETSGVFDILESSFDVGDVVSLKRVIDQSSVEIELPGGLTRVVYCDAPAFPKLRDGNRVVLDSSAHVVVRDLGKGADAGKFVFIEDTNISWDDVAGLAEAKKVMREAIELPSQHPDLYAAYGKKPLKGVLLEGPPGCGKTYLAKAAATSHSATHGQKGGFIHVKGPEILQRWVGESERNIRSIFEVAREFKKERGYPALIFIDESDAILGHRGSGVSADMERTIVPQFLSELDGLADSGATLILATNRPGSLDSAIVRDGRIDRKISVGRPTEKEAIDYFKIHLRNVPLAGDRDDRDVVAEFAAVELFSERHVVRSIELLENGTLKLLLSHLVSGAMIWGVVDQATSFAIERDLSSENRKKKAGGVSRDDVRNAIERKLIENQHLSHDEALIEVAKQVHEKRAVLRAAEA